jgi:hypothetical protein
MQVTRQRTLDDDPIGRRVAHTIVARSVLEAALREDEAATLVRGRRRRGSRRLEVDLSDGDLEELLGMSGATTSL